MSTNRTTPQSHYYSGQGRLIIGERDPVTGHAISLREVGNCTSVEVTVQTTKTDHKESMTGERSIDKTLVTEKSASFKVVCESLSLENLAMGLWGSISTGLAATVVDESHEIVKGGYIALAHQNVSAVVVETDETTPVVLVLNTDYTVDPDFGTVRFTQSVTIPTGGKVNVSYTGAAGNKTVHGLTEVMPPERFVRFEGVNTLDGELVLVEIPRAAFDPLQNLALINEEFASFEMAGSILRDNTITDAAASKYFRQTYITPAA